MVQRWWCRGGAGVGAEVVLRWCIGIVVQRCCRCMCRGGAEVVQESRGGPGAGVGPQRWCRCRCRGGAKVVHWDGGAEVVQEVQVQVQVLVQR